MQNRKTKQINWIFIFVITFIFFSCSTNQMLIDIDLSNKSDTLSIFILDTSLYVLNNEKPVQMIGGLELKHETNDSRELKKFAKIYRKCRIADLKGDGFDTYKLNNALNKEFIESNVSEKVIIDMIESGKIKKAGVIYFDIDKKKWLYATYGG